jgi:uncharacterized protein YdeI (BOF family)
MKHITNGLRVALTVCGLLLASIIFAGTANASASTDANSDAPWVTAADSPTSNGDFSVIKTNSTLSDPVFDHAGSLVTFNVTGPSNTSGYIWCKISPSLIPDSNAMHENVKVLLDGNQIEYMYTFNDGSWELFFNYTHSEHEVAISLPKEKITIFGVDPLIIAALVIVGVPVITVIILRQRKNNALKVAAHF